MISRLQQIRGHGVWWLHGNSLQEPELKYLRDAFNFHPLDIDECARVNHRPKINAWDDYLFVVLQFPYYDRRERKILSTELDFFIGREYLVTVGDGHGNIADRFFMECLKSTESRDKYLAQSSWYLLAELLRRLQDGIFPMLDHVTDDTRSIEQQIFAGSERRMVRELLVVKRNIVNFRRVMNAHKNIVKKMTAVHAGSAYSMAEEASGSFDNILERTKEIWEVLETQKEAINALHEANESLISFKLNDIMKILTVISVSIFSATLVAAIFATNAIKSMPIIDGPYGFWIIIGIICVVVSGVIAYFKSNEWL